jgi:exonuclease VII small subunit
VRSLQESGHAAGWNYAIRDEERLLMAAHELLCRARLTVSNLDSFARRFVALEKEVRESRTIFEATYRRIENRVAALESGFGGKNNPGDHPDSVLGDPGREMAGAYESRFQEHARGIQQLQDRVVRLERANRELAVRVEQLRSHAPTK